MDAVRIDTRGFTKALRSALRLLLSRRTAIVVMAGMAALLAFASLVPDTDLAPERLETIRRARPVATFLVERLRPQDLTRSPAFLVLPALVFFSTAWSVAERVRQEVRRRRGRSLPPLERFQVSRTLTSAQPADLALAAVRADLLRAGFQVDGPRHDGGGARVVTASRGPIGFAGSIVFHMGILVVLLGSVLSWVTRVNGELMLVESLPVELGPESVVHATNPAALERLRGTSVSIRDFTAEYERGFSPVDFAAVFDVRSGSAMRSEVVRVNEPVWVEDFQLTLHRYGFAPDLSVTGPSGEEILGGAAVLTVLPPGTEDGLALPDGTELRLALYPDHAMRGDAHVSRSLALLNPVLTVRRMRAGVELARAEVVRGGEAPLGELRVAFPAIHYWADFLVGRDDGLWWIAIGSALVALGLAARFMFDPQTLRITASEALGGARLDLVMSARYFPALNEERSGRLFRRIEDRLAAGQGRSAA